jgi:hypothetical protein
MIFHSMVLVISNGSLDVLMDNAKISIIAYSNESLINENPKLFALRRSMLKDLEVPMSYCFEKPSFRATKLECSILMPFGSPVETLVKLMAAIL